jgi:cell filamentation protein
VTDPYCYPNTRVLQNHAGIQDRAQLEAHERRSSARRISLLEAKPIPGRFDLAHLCEIHGFIFDEVYPFAGEVRTVDLHKGTSLFCKATHIETAAAEVFGALKKEGHLRRLEARPFVERAAHYLGEINALHPFREGNGRAQREFVRTLALQAGYALDWSRTDSQSIIDGSIQAFAGPDAGLLARELDKALVNRQPRPDLAASYARLTKGRGR